LPFYEENGVVLQRFLTDRGTEYCGASHSSSLGAIMRGPSSAHGGDALVTLC
jgi:hypothetical protein